MLKEKLAKLKPKQRLAVYGGIMFILGLFLGFLILPKILRAVVHSKVTLKPGTDVRKVWSKLPFPFNFRIWLFNVTNPSEIKNGEKPIVQEVGPYFFEEWHEKDNIIDNKDDDTVEYSMKDTFFFKPEMSGGLTGEEELMLPHIFILSIVMATLREKPSAMPAVNKAMNNIFKNPENVFIKAKAMDLMFRGLPIDCSVTDAASSAICNIVRENRDAFHVEDENHFRFSIFGPKNGTASKERYKSLRGKKNQNDIGVVVEYNGKKNISKWNDTLCDTIRGTDGYVFHPYLFNRERIVTFAPPLCRSLDATFERSSKALGVKTNRYSLWLGDPNTIPEEKCYCPDSGCLLAGVMDLHKCIGVPLVASHPHFYKANKTYLKMVDGLSPDREKHAIEIDFEAVSGSPILAKKRLQFNIMIFKVEKFKIMKNFPEALLPLFWIEEEFILSKDLILQVKLLRYARLFSIMVATGMILGGFSVVLYAAMRYFIDDLLNDPEVVKKRNEILKAGKTNANNNNSDTAGEVLFSISGSKQNQVPPAIQ